MAELHQILAVEKDIGKQKDLIIEETDKVLNSSNLFSGFEKTLSMFDDARKQEESGQATSRAITTTALDRIRYTNNAFIRHLDCIFQKEATNAIAKADIVIDDKTILKDVPVTMLIALEREFKRVRAIFKKIPTLQSGNNWVIDASLSDEIYKIETPTKSLRLEQKIIYPEMAPATAQHKAQVDKISDNSPVGEYTEWSWSGCITSKKKAEMLDNIESFIRATKTARAKANSQIVVSTETTKKIFDWILQ